MSDSMIAKGLNGQLELLGDRVKISRKGVLGFLTQGLKGDKEIAISSITSVQFAFMGGQEAKGGIFEAVNDENSIGFKKGQQADFERIKAELDRRRFVPPVLVTNISAADELAKFTKLRDQGAITPAEYEAKKKQLLGL